MMITAFPLFVFLFFIAQRQYLRWQMEEKLEKEQLTTITINAHDFKWYKEGKEIVVNGHLFDVEEIKRLDNDQLLITGLYDYQEQELHKQMDDWMSNENSHGKGPDAFVKWFSHLYDDKISNIDLSLLQVPLSENNVSYSDSLVNTATDVSTPIFLLLRLP